MEMAIISREYLKENFGFFFVGKTCSSGFDYEFELIDGNCLDCVAEKSRIKKR